MLHVLQDWLCTVLVVRSVLVVRMVLVVRRVLVVRSVLAVLDPAATNAAGLTVLVQVVLGVHVVAVLGTQVVELLAVVFVLACGPLPAIAVPATTNVKRRTAIRAITHFFFNILASFRHFRSGVCVGKVRHLHYRARL